MYNFIFSFCIIIKGSESKSVNRKERDSTEPKAKKAAGKIPLNEPVIDKNRMVSPPRFPVSKTVHVRNLVRPFTVNQLKALLSKTGEIVEDSFWIDKIKSHCLVSVSFFCCFCFLCGL